MELEYTHVDTMRMVLGGGRVLARCHSMYLRARGVGEGKH